MKSLPIGIQDFSKLRETGCLYVDKTREISRLISQGSIYFLSRPRRFGKSLLVSTLEEIFRGNKALFEGLYIYDKIDWTQQYPVVKIDWSRVKHSTAEEMERDMCAFLAEIAASHQVTLTREYASSRFDELIVRLYEKTGRQVVVLVDEYDMPILDALNSPADMSAILDFLQSFYKVIKGVDKYLRFVFLTGVSKFAKVSIFSGMNSLHDITLSDDYATICGYTQTELERDFDAYIQALMEHNHESQDEVLSTIRYWYNGYSWDGRTSVYNPFSTLLLFSEKKIINYWFTSGTPTFLVNQMKQRNDVKLFLEPSEILSTGFDSFELHTIDTQLLLFQTGYLTVKSVAKDIFSEQLVYTLGVPNEEVRQSLTAHLVGSYTMHTVSDTNSMRGRMLKQLFTGDVSALQRSMQELFARIPYQLHISREAYYHSLLLLWLNLLGFEVQGEVSTDKGRIDAVWTWEERVVVAEVKYTEDGPTEPLLQEALSQIHDRRYFERYAGANRRVALLAVAFAGRDIACRMEELSN